MPVYFSCKVVSFTEAPRLVCRSCRTTMRVFVCFRQGSLQAQTSGLPELCTHVIVHVIIFHVIFHVMVWRRPTDHTLHTCSDSRIRVSRSCVDACETRVSKAVSGMRFQGMVAWAVFNQSRQFSSYCKHRAELITHASSHFVLQAASRQCPITKRQAGQAAQPYGRIRKCTRLNARRVAGAEGFALPADPC